MKTRGDDRRNARMDPRGAYRLALALRRTFKLLPLWVILVSFITRSVTITVLLFLFFIVSYVFSRRYIRLYNDDIVSSSSSSESIK